jgi:PAS domain S-box-containing protein
VRPSGSALLGCLSNCLSNLVALVLRGLGRAARGLLIAAVGGIGTAQGTAALPIADDTLTADPAPIAAVRADADGDGRPDRLGDTLTVAGRASVGTEMLPDSALIFLQDETGGIAAHLPGTAAVNRGDSLAVRGVVQHRFGLTRLRVLDRRPVDALIRDPEPVPLTVSVAAGEAYEGQLIRVRGRVVANQTNEGGQYLLLKDAIQNTGSRLSVFVPARRLSDLTLDGFEAGDKIEIVGVLSQHDRQPPYGEAYQVLPRDQADLEGGGGMFEGYRTVILLIVGGAVLAVVAVFTLRTAVRRRTQQLAESRARFRRLAEATVEGIILHRDGEILDVNRALIDMLGAEREELLGSDFREVLSESTRDLVRDDDAPPDDPYEAVVVRRDGSSFPAEIDERVVERGDGSVRVAALRNVTERKRRETELLLAKEEAEQMARLKSSLLNNMSHEFRTPVTSILGYADLILEEPDVDHEPFARHIRRSGERLSRTLQAVVEMAQIESDALAVEPQSVEMQPLLREAADEYRAMAEEKDVTLHVSAPDDCTVETDRRLLRRVVDNLVHNAVKFTREGQVEVTAQDREAGVRITVADTGVGIDPAFRDQLFEPFTQESDGRTRTHEGMGLGLSLTKRMVDLVGGTIEVESQKGQGSTFVVEVPTGAVGSNGASPA